MSVIAQILLEAMAASDEKRANRLVAVGCALRLHPSAVEEGSAGADRVADEARQVFEQWIGQADSDEDAALRRIVLLLILDHTSGSTSVRTFHDFARRLHRRFSGR